MISRQHVYTDKETIRKIKSAIHKRKYAHPAEISLLWQNATGFPSIRSWPTLMLANCIASILLLLIFLIN